MLVFGHTGIALGAAALLAGTFARRYPKGNDTVQAPKSMILSPGEPQRRWNKWAWFETLGTFIDVRLLLIGSLLPDIIDKPTGGLLFREALSSGRTFAHTLFFLLLLTIMGCYLYRSRRQTWLLILAAGTFTHLILDRMWQEPPTLLWPLYGFAFPRADLSNWLPTTLHALLTDPGIYVPELVGAAILLWFALVLLRERAFFAFLRRGRVFG